MFRFIFKSLVICVLAYVVLSAVFYSQTGRWLKPTLSISSLPWFHNAPTMRTLEKPDQPTWRWQQNGRWHYGEQPPEGVRAERIDKSADQPHSDK